MKIRLILTILLVCAAVFTNHAQEIKLKRDEKPKFSVYDGVMVAGYVDKGAFLNFMGPNINFSFRNSKICLGMLPSLRFKEDHSIPKNQFVTPNLGAGLTYNYKRIAFQVPFYYNSKTVSKNGRWNIGVGVGIRLNRFRKQPA